MAADALVIRQLTESDYPASLQVIRESFATVAKQFGLTEQNAPTHPSFLSMARFAEMLARPVTPFGAFVGRQQVGFMALERAEAGVYHLERLAVLPKHRHKGYGLALVKHALTHVKSQGGTTVDIGIVDHHIVLKHWYEGLGFAQTGTKVYEHLPFAVCFMRRGV